MERAPLYRRTAVRLNHHNGARSIANKHNYYE